MKNITRTFLILGLIILNIAVDQISKFWIRDSVVPGSESEILGDYLTLHNVENTGAFLGMGSDFSPTLKILLLNVLPVAVLALVLFHIFRDKTLDRKSLVGFSFIIGGGMANIYDRILYGSVTDFLHIDLGGVFRTGIFNFADVSVMVGMGLLLLSNLKKKKA
ncbi:signal peptidase II [Bizionia gelidisalsuginis]|uniref:Lipoprotein signal peptidase n=2 Tax=Bizionia TaxID=283785 RepID=A0A8H2LEP1_9FLAO|nr:MULTISPECIES: signal peptidase II [Bizionia]TYB73954.1 signal peptidase II [Bizionia saleffrena]TYC08471.1 signal peptidase II [Bizionia gelidisalsuginis]